MLNIFEAERTEIFNYFWQILESWDARKHYVAAMTDKIKSENNNVSKRKCSNLIRVYRTT